MVAITTLFNTLNVIIRLLAITSNMQTMEEAQIVLFMWFNKVTNHHNSRSTSLDGMIISHRYIYPPQANEFIIMWLLTNVYYFRARMICTLVSWRPWASMNSSVWALVAKVAALQLAMFQSISVNPPPLRKLVHQLPRLLWWLLLVKSLFMNMTDWRYACNPGKLAKNVFNR